MAEGAVVLVALLFAVGFPLGLYVLIKRETSDPTIVDRETAEREAKERGGLRGRGRTKGTASEREQHDADERTNRSSNPAWNTDRNDQ